MTPAVHSCLLLLSVEEEKIDVFQKKQIFSSFD